MPISFSRLAAMLAAALAFAASAPALAQKVRFVTSAGDIVVEVDAAKSPKTVANFLEYVKGGHYDGTIFHRVIANFMIQGGGMTPDMKEKSTRPPVVLESKNGLTNQRGTIAMARTSDPNSATAQFFINVKDNGFLDYRDPSPQGIGYTVFGRVVEGMNVVMQISRVETTAAGMQRDVPKRQIIIESVTVKPGK
jgi:peptidyl-prolyl cis-trans isomerase A (cyclophilin A)